MDQKIHAEANGEVLPGKWVSLSILRRILGVMELMEGDGNLDNWNDAERWLLRRDIESLQSIIDPPTSPT